MDEFEFDATKSQTNHDKHGIDFVAAQVLWKDPYLLEVYAKSEGEKHWSAIVTRREDRIRLISVRRSRKQEVELHEN